jgi:hypothetical protein
VQPLGRLVAPKRTDATPHESLVVEPVRIGAVRGDQVGPLLDASVGEETLEGRSS